MAKEYQIPFDMDKMHQCLHPWMLKNPNTTVIMRDNYIFAARLKFMHMQQNNSSVGFILQDADTNFGYYMNMSEFHSVLNSCDITNGEFCGKFTFVKRGNMFSLTLLEANIAP